jgi:DNA uptake protein ComE-like DNA-binding protein
VGPTTARKIVEFRQKHGRIASADDLNQIEGIDSATIENLKRETAHA